MKYSFKSFLLYSAAFTLSLYACDAFAYREEIYIKRTRQKTQHKTTGRLQPQLAKPKVDFSHPYPLEWNELSLRDFFSTLQNEKNLTPQFVVDWCNGMVSVFEYCPREINEITLSRLITLLGQKAKQEKQIKAILQKFFTEKPELMKYWRERTTQSLKEEKFNQQELSNIFYSHALLELKPDTELYKAWNAAALSRLNSTNPKEQFEPQHLSNIFYGHAKLGMKPDEILYKTWRDAALSRLTSTDLKELFDQQELSNIFYGHALLGLKPNEELYKAWENATLTYLTSKNPKEQFKRQELSNIFYGHAKLGMKPDEILYKAWRDAALSCLKSTNPKEQFGQQALSNIFYGHALLGLKPNEELYKAWENATLTHLTSKNPKEQFKRQELSNIFYGYALLGLKPNEELYKAWENATLTHLTSKNPKEQFKRQELSNIFYGHALIELKPERELYEAWKGAALPYLKPTDPKEKFSLKELHSIYLTMKRFSLEHLLEDSFPQASLLESCKAIAPKVSKLQNDVYQSLQSYLRKINLSDLPREEYWVDDIASCVDIFLVSKKIIIEVEGPSHFFPGTKKYKPKNKLREEILNQTHKFTKLVRIPYYEWEELATLESKQKYLENKLSLSLGHSVQTVAPKIEELEIKQEKHIAKTSDLKADAAPFIPQAERMFLMKKPPSKKECEESSRELQLTTRRG